MLQDVTGLILDGGRARRLGGRHKAFLELSGRSIAERTVETLARQLPEILVATDRPEPWRSLPVRCVADPVPDAGPLAGLVAGLEASSRALVFVVGADMPRLSEEVLVELVERARRLPGRAVVPMHEGRAQVLHAVYPSSFAAAAREALEAGTRKLSTFLKAAGVSWLDSAELAGLPGAAFTFHDVDTPADLEREARP